MKNTIMFTLTMLAAPYPKAKQPIIEPCFVETTQAFATNCLTSCNTYQPVVIGSREINKITDKNNWCRPFVLNVV